MFGSTILVVVLGLVFVYFVFSTICSKINEVVSAKLGWRAHDFEKWLRKALEHPDQPGDVLLSVARFKNSSMITAITPERAKRNLPSYVSPRTFSLTVLDLLAPGDGQVGTMDEVKAALAALPDGHPAKAPLMRLAIEAANDLGTFRAGVEGWFNDSMSRVSGWYKRRVQRWLLVYATVLTLALNIDTIVVARTLWSQDGVRQAVVAQVARQNQAAAPGQDATAMSDLNNVAGRIADVGRLGIPIGWVQANRGGQPNPDPRRWPGDDPGDLLVKALGLALTIAALSLGAPFWFDLLNKVSRLRSAGERPATTPSLPTPSPNQPVLIMQPEPPAQ